MEDIETLNKSSIDSNESAADSEQNNITVWIVAAMLIIWIYVIMTSLF